MKLYVETVHTGGAVPGNMGNQGQMSKTFPMAGTHGSMGTPTQAAHQAIVDSLQQGMLGNQINYIIIPRENEGI